MSSIRTTFRRRAVSTENVQEWHQAVMARLSKILTGTVADFDLARVYFETDNNASSGAADLTPAFRDTSFEGAISYCPRKVIDADHGKYDDVLTVMVPRFRDVYSAFVLDPFAKIAEAFEAYRATVAVDEDLDLDDFDQIVNLCERTHKDVDGRDGVFRIGPANVFDDELCFRAFRLRAAEVVQRVHAHTEVARLAGHSAFFLVTTELLDRDELLVIDRRMRALLAESS